MRAHDLEAGARRAATACEFKTDVFDELDSLVRQAKGALHARAALLLEPGDSTRTGEGPSESDGDECQWSEESIEERVYEYRAILPPSVFGLLREIRSATITFGATMDRLIANDGGPLGSGDAELLRGQLEKADALYGDFVELVRDFFASCT